MIVYVRYCYLANSCKASFREKFFWTNSNFISINFALISTMYAQSNLEEWLPDYICVAKSNFYLYPPQRNDYIKPINRLQGMLICVHIEYWIIESFEMIDKYFWTSLSSYCLVSLLFLFFLPIKFWAFLTSSQHMLVYACMQKKKKNTLVYVAAGTVMYQVFVPICTNIDHKPQLYFLRNHQQK